MVEQVRWATRPTVLGEVRGRANHGVALWLADWDHDHVAGHKTRGAYAEIETVRDDVHQAAFGHQIDMHLRVTLQKRQHQRQQRGAGGTGEGIDAQYTRRPGIVRTHRFQRGTYILQRRTDLLQVHRTRLG